MPAVEKNQDGRVKEHDQNPSFFHINLRVIIKSIIF